MTKIDLINGFLGSGKTTFISRYLRWLADRGERVAVIENEFGTAGVDTAILSRTGAAVVELSGGCICCGQKVNFYHLLRDLAASGEWDRILVEPSGVFNCDDFLDITASPAVAANAALNAIITILTPGDLDVTEGPRAEMMYAQLHSSGAVLVSRRAAPDPDLAARTRSYVNGLFRRMGLEGSFGGPVVARDWEGLTDGEFAALERAGWRRAAHWRSTMDHSRFAQSAVLRPRRGWGAEALRSALSRAMDGHCGTVYRVKGQVGAERAGAFLEVNATPDRTQVTAVQGGDGRLILNVIGSGLDRRELKALLE